MVRFSLSIILLFAFYGSFNAQKYPEKTVDSLLQQGINQLLVNDYEKALTLFKKLSDVSPRLPFGDIYSAVTLIIKSEDYLVQKDKDQIIRLIESSEEKAENLLEEDDDFVWNIYTYALSKGLKAYYYGLEKSYLKAFDGGIDALRLFEKCLEKNENFYEALIAIGTYKYWKSIKLKPVLWMPFIKDEVKTGKVILEQNLDKTFYNKALAAYSLSWIYINEKEYTKAVNLSKSFLKKYPENRLFLWAFARALEETEPEEAIEAYENILESLPEEGKTLNNKILILHKQAMIYDRLGKKDKALKLSSQILDIYSEPEISYDIKMRIERVIKMKEKLEK